MLYRQLTPHLQKSIQRYPVLTLIGPRQSGKTTLIKNIFDDYEYYNMEDPDLRLMIKEDPRGFLNQLGEKVILDEYQRVPDLSSYLQVIVDKTDNKQKFILTGSNGLMLVDSITQTLAGRTELFELLPLSIAELSSVLSENDLYTFLFKGGYPRIYDQDLDATKWLKSYFKLYVEKDIRSLTNISQIDLFEKFIRLAAGRAGQLINASSLANEVGVSSPTISSWIAALKSTYICFNLQPHFKNFNKRLVKTPKLYFYDTGLLCYLLGINNHEQLQIHPLRGNIFENFIISEYLKLKQNQNIDTNLYFWRDQKGHEIDLIEDKSNYLYPLEIKMSETFSPDFIKNIAYLNRLQGDAMCNIPDRGSIIYSGKNEKLFKDIKLNHWFNFFK